MKTGGDIVHAVNRVVKGPKRKLEDLDEGQNLEAGNVKAIRKNPKPAKTCHVLVKFRLIPNIFYKIYGVSNINFFVGLKLKNSYFYLSSFHYVV